MKLQSQGLDDFDILTFVATGKKRKRKRGYDHVELLARFVARELNVSLTYAVKKVRDTPPQSSLTDASMRRANVLGAYQVIDPQAIDGKRVLLLDDIITTGATASECARILLVAGAKEVNLAAIAASSHENKKGYR